MTTNPTSEAHFYIVDLRPEWRENPYVTVWRPDDAGYAYPLSWAGKYSKGKVDADPGYYANRGSTVSGKPRSYLDRFPVPCAVVEALAIPAPAPWTVDGDAGPVLVNDGKTRAALRRAKYLPTRPLPTTEG